MRLFWLAVSAIALLAFVIYLVGQRSSSPVSSDQIANATYLGIIGLVAASAVLGSGIPLTHLMRNIFIWLAIIFALMIGYNNRYELQDTLHKLTAGIIPSSPVSSYDNGRLTVTLSRANNGHFETAALVNGKPVHFMVDTGASSVALSFRDAQRIGIDTDKLNYVIPVRTANGTTKAASIVLDTLNVGSIMRTNVHALVALPDSTGDSLLGMAFLNRLSGYTVRGDRLILAD